MTRVWPLYRALVGVGLLCGLLVVGAYVGTAPIIERNRAEALSRAILDVLPGSTSTATFAWTGSGFEPAAGGDGERVHVGYDASGAVVGLAIEAEGMGYQDVIKLLYGFHPGDLAIVGFAVLESRETPGLGDKIDADPAFHKNFEHLVVSEPWNIDIISGATISSRAVESILKDSSGVWAARVGSAHREGSFDHR